MNRPSVLRQIVSHVARSCAVPYRLRTADAKRLAEYVEHLEANQRPAAAGASCARSVVLDPEERVLAELDVREHTAECSLHPDHTGECVAFVVA